MSETETRDAAGDPTPAEWADGFRRLARSEQEHWAANILADHRAALRCRLMSHEYRLDDLEHAAIDRVGDVAVAEERLSEAQAEVSRLRAVVEAVQALADEWAVRAGDISAWPKSRIDIHEAVYALRAVLAPVSSSGEAGSGEAEPYDPKRWCRHPECKDTNWGGWGRVHLRDSKCPPDPDGKYLDRQPRDAPAPVLSGGQADGEGELSTAEVEIVIGALDNLASDCRTMGRFGYAAGASTLATQLRLGRLRITGTAGRTVLSREALTAAILGARDGGGNLVEYLSASTAGVLADAVLDVLAGGEQA